MLALIISLPILGLLVFLALCIYVDGFYGDFLDLVRNHNYHEDGRKLESVRPIAFPWGNFQLLKDDPEKLVKNLHETMDRNDGFAVTYFLWNPNVLSNNLEFMKRVYSTEILKKSRRDLTKITIWERLFGRGLFMLSDANEWKKSHKVCIRGMGSKFLTDYYVTVQEVADKSVARLEEKIKLHKGPIECEIRKFFQDYTLEAIFLIAFGKGDSKPEERRRVADLFDTAIGTQESDMRFTLPGFIDMPFETPRKIRSAIKELQEYGARVVKNHRTKMKEGKIDPNAKGTLLSALCEKAEDGSEFSDTLVLENVYSFMFAGLDTSSTALAHAMIHLARHPAVQEKARKEALAHKEVDFEIVMNGLPYLACVAREALRLCPPINGIGGNREIKEGITFNGKRIAKDTGIGACQLAHHRNPKIWGKDAEVFRPDRHMKEDVYRLYISYV
ncbi:hypothetical protein AAMO2058_001446700 [Amorphochlora amoebiformis]